MTPTRRLLVVISLKPEPGFAALVARGTSRLPERVGFHGITSNYLPNLIINRRAFIVNRKNRDGAAGGRVGGIFSLTAKGAYVNKKQKLTYAADVRVHLTGGKAMRSLLVVSLCAVAAGLAYAESFTVGGQGATAYYPFRGC
jgi:hypothetical protein